ncbi:MAG: hypothetical protein D6679_08135 [Candidatus Hydrogenedentota bacterium]|nr:MAG: hypothetical protein D6679_08135 [Candidatus Hydrogenedentota bacterium]
MIYSYRARDPIGRIVTGELEAPDEERLLAELRGRALRPISYRPIGRDGVGGGRGFGWKRLSVGKGFSLPTRKYSSSRAPTPPPFDFDEDDEDDADLSVDDLLPEDQASGDDASDWDAGASSTQARKASRIPWWAVFLLIYFILKILAS